ncbi:MAG: GntR family transcriptional regulator [Nocardioidaceae bacterium]
MSAPSAREAVVPPFAPNRNSPVPLYFQVATHLESAILSGEIRPGTLFENEIQLANEMGLSRPTMRRAMQHLVDKGLVVRRRGVGTRVVQPKVRRPLELTSLYDDLSATGQEPTTTVLGFEYLEADIEIAEALQIQPGDPVVRIERLRSAQGSPIAKMINFIPAPLVKFDRAALEEHGLYELFRRSGVTLHSAAQTIGARNSRGNEARTLGESRGAALLTMTRTSFDDHGQAVEYATHLYAASRYTFEIHLLSP